METIDYIGGDFPNTGGFPETYECPGCKSTDEPTETTSTPEEIKSPWNCGRSYACCCIAFICTKCGVRFRASRAAPEIDWEYSYSGEGE